MLTGNVAIHTSSPTSTTHPTPRTTARGRGLLRRVLLSPKNSAADLGLAGGRRRGRVDLRAAGPAGARPGADGRAVAQPGRAAGAGARGLVAGARGAARADPPRPGLVRARRRRARGPL